MHGLLQVFLGSQSGLMLMFCIFKLNFEIDIWAILAWHLFWLLFPKFEHFFQPSGHLSHRQLLKTRL